MEQLSIAGIVKAAGGRLLRKGDKSVKGISIDSRKVQPADLYFAIKGERFDGHQFARDAVENGAAGVVVSDPEQAPDKGVVILVKDTRKALGDVAGLYRAGLDTRVVAVTGSNGKTTVKDMIGALLDLRLNVVKARASFNNDIGVPLTVFRLEPDTDVGVFEIEMNQLGGTRRLARVCKPEVGVVTNIGDTHLEFMRDRQGVAHEKAELLEELPESGTAVLNADDPLVMEIGHKSCGCAQLTFGLEVRADVYAADVRDLGLEGFEFMLQGTYRVRMGLLGSHNVSNCLAACAGAHALGMEFADMARAIAGFKVTEMRLKVMKLGDVVLIDDSYNANPQSMRVALEVLCHNTHQDRRVAILGDMLELGEHSIEAHTEIGRLAATCLDRVVFVGTMAEHAASVALKAGMESEKVRLFAESGQVPDGLFDIIRPGDTILVKGSRAMKMELVTDAIKKYYGRESD